MDPISLPAHIFALLLAVLPPCPTEDSANCGWNAQTMGDGNGISFVDVGGVWYIAQASE